MICYIGDQMVKNDQGDQVFRRTNILVLYVSVQLPIPKYFLNNID